MSLSPRAGLAVVAAILLLGAAPITVVVAQSLTHQSSAGVTYETTSGVEVTLGDQRDVAAVPFADDQTFADKNVTISGSDAAVEIDDATYEQTPLTVRAVDVQSSGSLTVARTDLGREVTVVEGDANLLQVRDFAVGNGSQDIGYDSDTGVTIRLTGLPSVGVAA